MLTKKDYKWSCELYNKHSTLYIQDDITPKACILYFHGGGLLYGLKNDLPDSHIEFLTKEGYAILCCDYPLAPAAKLDIILKDVKASVNEYENVLFSLCGLNLPFFLWGRSAGAYLCLLAASKGDLSKTPLGIISYYGYGFLTDAWFNSPSSSYTALPAIDESCLCAIPSDIHADGPLDTHYSVYVYARQTGKWVDLIYEGREKFFYLDYTLRSCSKMPCPLFCAHSINDGDVPYAEFIELSNRFSPQCFTASENMHDFDRIEKSNTTHRLLCSTLDFLENNLA